MIPVTIHCVCGQKYTFEAEPIGGKMPMPVTCPMCHCDGTEQADQIIAEMLNNQIEVLPPPSVTELLNSVESCLAPHLVTALKDAVVQELAAQRHELLAVQQAANAELAELARRLESVQTPLLERLRAYEQHITELESELGEQTKENRELLKLKIDLLREKITVESGSASGSESPRRINFN
jgi:hypothetical protein